MWGGWSESRDEDDGVASSFAESLSHSQPSHVDLARSDESDDYDDDDFDDYSDEFECDDDAGAAEEAVGVGVHDRVQVYWPHESEWFDGSVAHLGSGRFFVHYSDGDAQWEALERIRLAPPDAFRDAQQLQHVSESGHSLVGRRTAVYWREESAWFEGCVSDARGSDRGMHSIHITYDDGDDQWITESSFLDVLLLRATTRDRPNNADRAACPCPQDTEATTSSDCTITPRKYTPLVDAHFEPVRMARPYMCAVRSHIGSVIMPRSAAYLMQRPYYLPIPTQATREMEYVTPQHDTQRLLPTRACQVQTDISTGATSSA